MATNCKQLSPKARQIFDKLKRCFPRGAFGEPRWRKSGKIYDNGWFDLRKSADRKKLAEKTRSSLGHFVEIEAELHLQEHGSLNTFDTRCFTRLFKTGATLALLLKDLDYQIETGDLVGD